MIDIEKFIEKRPYLYHLTDRRNIDQIMSAKQITCTKSLVSQSTISDKQEFLTTKRSGHKVIEIDDSKIYIRDQDPIIKKVLVRSLDKDCSYEDFIMMLNSRVFFWPTLKDLQKHFGRYQNENPIIIRINTQELYEMNKPPKFCKLNSGAPRPIASHKGNAAPRGYKTFLSAEECPFNYTEIREVTFEGYCKLPQNIYLSSKPDGEFSLAK